MDIKYQSLTHPFITLHIHQCQAVVWAPPFPPHFLSNHVFWLECVAGAGRLQRGREEGGSATAARAAKRDKSSRGTPPLVRWTSLPHSRLLLLPSPSPFFPSSLPRCFSIIHQCADSPQLTAPAAAPADPSSPLGLLAYSSFFHAHPSILPDFHSQAWKLRAGPFLLLRERVSHHRAALLAAEKKRNPRGEKRGFFFPPSFWVLEESWSSASNLPPSSLFGLQFWLCVGTRKRGPKCLKPITCCRCLGVTLRCVALIYVACGDTALASL